MIKDTTKIQYIDYIKAINIKDNLEYYMKLKDGYYFKMTNSNSVHVYSILDLNRVINYGIKWGIR